MKDQAWSYSALTTFEQCPKKYYHLKIAKDFKEEESDAQIEGKEVHEAMEKRVVYGKPLPLPLRHYEQMAAPFAKLPHQKHGEMKMALNKKFEPREFFAPDVWVRAVLDLLIVKEPKVIIVDWKTGRRRENYIDYDQLKLTAAVLSRYMPEIKEFEVMFGWLKANKFDRLTIRKEEMVDVWRGYLSRVKELQGAVNLTEFPAKEGPLCSWCPVVTCPNWKEPRQ